MSRIPFIFLTIASFACGPGAPGPVDAGDVADAGGAPDAGGPDAGGIAGTGELDVVVTGLPVGVQGGVVVKGPDGNTYVVRETARLTGLIPGRYTADALAATTETETFVVDDSETKELELGEQTTGASIAFAYRRLVPALAPNAKPVDDVPDEAVPTTTGATLTFPLTAPGAGTLAVGDVVGLDVGLTTPQGFLGKVTSVREVDGRLEVDTDRATLADAVTAGAISVDRAWKHDDVQGAEVFLEGVSQTRISPVVQNGIDRPDPDTMCMHLESSAFLNDALGNRFTATGVACFRPTTFLSVWIEDGKVKAHVAASVVQSADVHFEAKQPIEVFRRAPLPLMAFRLPQIRFNIGQLPVIIQPMLNINAQTGVSILEDFELDAAESFAFTAGAKYDGDEWTGYSYGRTESTLRELRVPGGVEVRAGIGPSMDFFLYGVAGPSIGLDVYAKFDAVIDRDPWWAFYVGIDGFVGGKLSAFTYWTLVDVQLKVMDQSWRIVGAPAGQTRPIRAELDKHVLDLEACQRGTATVTLRGSQHPDEVDWLYDERRGTRVLANGKVGTVVAGPAADSLEITAQSREQPFARDRLTVNITGTAATMNPVVQGLPAGVEPDVVLSAPGEADVRLTGTGGPMPCVHRNTWTATARAVTADGKVYTPRFGIEEPGAVVTKQFPLQGGQSADFLVLYEHRVGSLRVNTTGEASTIGDNDITVTGPLGYARRITATSEVLSLLNPGTYTVIAQPKVIGGVTHRPEPASQQLDVLISQTVEANIRYVPVTANALWVLGTASSPIVAFTDTTQGSAFRLGRGMVGNCMGCSRDMQFDSAGNLYTTVMIGSKLLVYRAEALAGDPEPMSTVTLPGSPAALAIDANDDVWVELSIVDPPTRVVRYPGTIRADPTVQPNLTIDLPGGTLGAALAFDGDGNLWVSTDTTISLYSAASIAAGTPELVRSHATGMRIQDMTFRGGALWAASSAPSQVVRFPAAVVADGTFVPDFAITAGYGLNGLTFDRAGDLWIAYAGGSGAWPSGVHKVAANQFGTNVTLPTQPATSDYTYLQNAQKPRWRYVP